MASGWVLLCASVARGSEEGEYLVSPVAVIQHFTSNSGREGFV